VQTQEIEKVGYELHASNKCEMMKLIRYFVFLCGLSLVIWWDPILQTLRLALDRDGYTQILLIIPVSVALIYREVSTNAHMKPSYGVGSALLVLAALVVVVARWQRALLSADIQLFLSMLALVVWWVGSFIFCFGAAMARRCLFPLCFLLWMVPLPQFALDKIVGLLQQGSAFVAQFLFTLARVPVTKNGTMLSIPNLTVQIAEECSSIRSSLMLVVTSMVLAHLLLRSLWGKSLVVLAAIPLSIAKNGLRVFTLSMLGAYVEPAVFQSRLHREGGILFFIIALVALAILLWVVRRTESVSSGAPVASKRFWRIVLP
jgi:exosortase